MQTWLNNLNVKKIKLFKMKLFPFVLFIVMNTTSFCQTKMIAFRSHSGSDENFRIALENKLFDTDASDFGAAPERTIVTAQLDSVIFVSDSLTILVTSQFCTNTFWGRDETKGNPVCWKAGREMVCHNLLFSRNHSLDSIKKIIKEQYYFRNKVEKVVFVGYDNDNNRCKEDSNYNKKVPVNYLDITPAGLSGGGNDQSPFDAAFFGILGLIFFLSSAGAFLVWKNYQWRGRKNKVVSLPLFEMT
jgi:hypothetical protein